MPIPDTAHLTILNSAGILCGKPDYSLDLSTALTQFTELGGSNARRDVNRLVILQNGANSTVDWAINKSGSRPSSRDGVVPRSSTLRILVHAGSRIWLKGGGAQCEAMVYQ